MPKLQLGDSAPDVTVADHQGRPLKLSQSWASRPLVLIFLRHLG